MSTIILTVGAPGTGKSTFLKEKFKEHEIISSDYMRYLICGDENNQNVTGEAWHMVEQLARAKLLTNQKYIVIDSTGAKRKDRIGFIQKLRGFLSKEDKIIAYVFKLTLEETLKRNSQREKRNVPENKVSEMYKNILSYPPSLDEGFDEIQEINL